LYAVPKIVQEAQDNPARPSLRQESSTEGRAHGRDRLMARSEDYIMVELRKAQKALIGAKKRGGKENIAACRARIAELQKEMEGV
jgi:hypothetical protein